ncbi:MAG: lipid II:glycine glycyltransferase FemX [Limisphaerales bacterium]
MQTPYEVTTTPLHDPEWHDILNRFDDTSVYQTRSFGEACWKAGQLSHFVLRKNSEILAAAQVRIVALPLIRRGVAYVRWGPLVRRRGGIPDPGILDLALRSLHAEYSLKRKLLLRVIHNNYSGDALAPPALEILGSNGFRPIPNSSPYHTHRVDLTLSIEELRKNLSQRWRSKLKNAERAGYSVSQCDSDSAYERFLGAYDQMMARKRFATTVDVREFATMQKGLLPGQRMRVFLCEKDGNLLNALVVAPGGDSGIYLLAATSDAGLQENGAFLLQWHAIQWLKESGRAWYDLGGVNPDANPGVYQFKSGMGGHDVHQLGQFDSTTPGLSLLLLGVAERIKRFRRGNPRQPDPKTPAVPSPSHA